MRKLPTISGGSGPRFVRVTGRASRIDNRDAQGDVIATDALLEGVREGPILITRDLFETISPETALARLLALGVRVILSPGFEARFYQRCLSHGLLALPLPEEAVDTLADHVESELDAELTIDLDKQVIEREGEDPIPFEVEPRVRQKLLLGLTDMEEMLRHVSSTAARREEDRRKRPWLYGGT